MSNLPLDAKIVLMHLNALGYRNITSEQLKEFIRDLKKLIKYDMKMEAQGFRVASKTTVASRSKSRDKYRPPSSTEEDEEDYFLKRRFSGMRRSRSVKGFRVSSNGSEGNVKSRPSSSASQNIEDRGRMPLKEDNRQERRRPKSVTKDKSKSPRRVNGENKRLQDNQRNPLNEQNNRQSRDCSQKIDSERSRSPQNSQPRNERSKSPPKKDALTALKEELTKDLPEVEVKSHLGAKKISSDKADSQRGKPPTRQSARSDGSKASKGWIRPTQHQKPKQNDPVALYQYYKKEWEKFKPCFPGENSWTDIRWEIRNKLKTQR